MKTEFEIYRNGNIYRCIPQQLAYLNGSPVRIWELRRKIENGWLFEDQFSSPRQATKSKIIGDINVITNDDDTEEEV